MWGSKLQQQLQQKNKGIKVLTLTPMDEVKGENKEEEEEKKKGRTSVDPLSVYFHGCDFHLTEFCHYTWLTIAHLCVCMT